jgi:hypothetical protein
MVRDQNKISKEEGIIEKETSELEKALKLIHKAKMQSFIAHQKSEEDETTDEDKAAAFQNQINTAKQAEMAMNDFRDKDKRPKLEKEDKSD